MESNTWWARLPADDFVGISGRCERPLFGFVFDDEAIDSGLQADERHKDADLVAKKVIEALLGKPFLLTPNVGL